MLLGTVVSETFPEIKSVSLYLFFSSHLIYFKPNIPLVSRF